MSHRSRDGTPDEPAVTGRESSWRDTARSSLDGLLASVRWLHGIVEQYATVANVVGLAFGMYLGSVSVRFADGVNRAVSGLVGAYDIVAPFVVFLVVAPALGQLVANREGRPFVGRAMTWLAFNWVLACVWGAAFTALAFGMPLLPHGTTGAWEAVTISLSSLFYTLGHSKVFLALYAGIGLAILARRRRRLLSALELCAAGLEVAGGYFATVVPLLMLAVGAYVVSLPRTLLGELDVSSRTGQLQAVSLVGIEIDARTPEGILLFYSVIALLTGAATIIWHLSLLARTKRAHPAFSLRHYFHHYWLKINPLLFTTCSESLVAPLNLFLARRHFPEVPAEVRRFSITTGASIDQNGTRITAFLMAGAVAALLGLPLSFTDLLMAVPLVMLIGLAIPGIPGELVLFAGPLATLFGVDAATLPVFMALYAGLQFGLPDSFRTCVNSSDRLPVMMLVTKLLGARRETRDRASAAEAGEAIQPVAAPAVGPLPELQPRPGWVVARPRFRDREVRRIFKRAGALARFHVALNSPACRLLESLQDAVATDSVSRLAEDTGLSATGRYVSLKLRYGLVREAETGGGNRALVRTELGERALNAITALERRIGAEAAAAISEADLGPNCFRLFLRLYTDGGKEASIVDGRSTTAYSWERVSELTMFLPRRIEALAAIEMLANAGLLIYDDAKQMLTLPSVRARAFYQYLTALSLLMKRKSQQSSPEQQRPNSGLAMGVHAWTDSAEHAETERAETTSTS